MCEEDFVTKEGSLKVVKAVYLFGCQRRQYDCRTELNFFPSPRKNPKDGCDIVQLNKNEVKWIVLLSSDGEPNSEGVGLTG